MVKSVRVVDESCVVLVLPILQIFQEIYESWLVQNPLLSERMQVERIRERLHEFEFEFEPGPVRRSGIVWFVYLEW